MKHRISEGGSLYGSLLAPPLLRHRSIPDNNGEKRPVLEDYSTACEAEEDGGGEEEEEEIGIAIDNHVYGEATAYEVNDKELESDEDGYGYEKDEEEDEGVEPEETPTEEAIAPVDVSDGGNSKLAEGFYEVEAIRRKRICKGEPQFLIKWRGWPESSNTWEPLEHLNLCPDIVEAYEQSLNSGKKKRKRKCKYTQPKKKLHYSYATSGSKEHNADVKKSKVGRKPSAKKPSYEPSYTQSKDTNDDENSSDKDNDTRKITIQLQEAAKGDGSSVNSSSKADSAELSQGDRRTGAKRRKSGSVQRFKPISPPSDPSHAANSIPINGSYDTGEQLMLGNIDPYPKIKFDFTRDSSAITRILKPIGYSTSKSNDIDDVLVTFVAMRSDGKEMVVDNKFLKVNYPQVLIDFYEQHLRYSPAT